MLTGITSHFFNVVEEIKLSGRVAFSPTELLERFSLACQVACKVVSSFHECFVSYHLGWDTDNFELPCSCK